MQVNPHGLQKLLCMLNRAWAEHFVVMNTTRDIAPMPCNTDPSFEPSEYTILILMSQGYGAGNGLAPYPCFV